MGAPLLTNVSQCPTLATMNLLTAKEAADQLGVPVRTFNRWVSAGRIVAVAQGPGVRGARLFAVADVEKARAS